MSKLTEKQKKEIAENIARYDTNKDGKVSVEEFTTFIKPYLTPEVFKQVLARFNTNKDGEISLEEFESERENDPDA